MKNANMTRRTLLRGAGVALALPYLEAIAFAQTGKSEGEAPLRMAFLFVPNGINMAHWTPATEGALGALPHALEPLAGLKDHFNVLTGLTQNWAFAHGDGGGDHARSAAAWLTGCKPVKTSGANIKVGLSADQLAAAKRGSLTRFPSLEIGCERGGLAGDCDSGYSCAYSNTISWRTENSPVSKETDPRLVFERLFGGEDVNESAEAREQRKLNNKSILDFVLEDAKSLQGRLGAHDRHKMDEYFTGIREIERRMSFLEKAGKETGVSGEALKARMSGGMPDYPDHVRLLGDMMVLAFQADITRISTFMFANEGSNRAYKQIGINDGHHETSHHGRNPEKLESLKKINRFHVEQLAYILQKMQSVKEGKSTLLDNTMLVYGGGISDGDRHNHDDLPLLIAGGAGGTLKGGQHIKYKNGTPMTNLLITMLDRFGVPGETLGDSTGKVQQLF
ncbi:MAG: DUF1552 domain-containing protein [Armatimonadetes bacterium]|nr:DUF1552 domain-containing protein [Armatimonadota bacterium]